MNTNRKAQKRNIPMMINVSLVTVGIILMLIGINIQLNAYSINVGMLNNVGFRQSNFSIISILCASTSVFLVGLSNFSIGLIFLLLNLERRVQN
ncbi:hypothetical protein SAMN05192551_10597 [Tindallia magadiensis]|uniref:Uncharacterized protein n=1 Tax=Tindallia magadiensis TaxID=69895 RepID=A0A1I3EPL2_9FIRM|nr:hypothetical protein [Tindallia magadiensis]SFI00803.1 hypothetical protein SAMN05192551_10597 [Tindallia magadiensis]